MQKNLFLLFLWVGYIVSAQAPAIQTKGDSISKFEAKVRHSLSTGYYTLGFFDIDLKTLVKFDGYQGVRLGIGGLTNDRLFEKYKFGGYVAYGFLDADTKYGINARARINKEKNSWFKIAYSEDIQEIGSFDFLTDDRVYSLFEPRGVNIVQFYKYYEWSANYSSELTPKLLSGFLVSHGRIENLVDYYFIQEDGLFHNYKLSEASISFRYSPKTVFFTNEDGTKEYFDGLPKISAQVTQGFKDILASDFNYTKLGLKLDYYIKRKDLSSTNFILEGLLAIGDVPLSHLFHSFPNQPRKSTWMGRFSVAGIQSFETMYFGEFFSDRLAMLQIKHSLRRFRFSEKLKPELVLITRHAWGDMSNTQAHFGIPFDTLDHLYNEAGLELNKILLGFGLSAAYRYGYYHLPQMEDNISFKFTFNLKI